MPRSSMWTCVFFVSGITFFGLPLAAQQPSADRAGEPVTPAPVKPDDSGKRIFGIIPNYKTFPLLKDYKPISAKEKWKIATQDAFDRGTFALAAAFAGYSQLTKANPSFGQGV